MDILKYLRFLANQTFRKDKIVTERARSVFDIDYGLLSENKVRLIIFDIDDTLTAHLEKLPKRSMALLKKLSNDGFKVAIISNRRPKENRIKEEIKEAQIFIEKTSKKPSTQGYRNIMEHLKTGPRNTAMVGDRPGTDMWGAHRAGIKHTILVEPYSEAFGGKKPGAIIRLARAAEKRWLIS